MAISKKTSTRLGIAIVLVAALGLVLLLSLNSPTSSKQPATSPAPVDRSPLALTHLVSNQPPRPGYIGPSACAQCHRDHHDSFMQTKHPRTCREVVAADMPDGFTGDKAHFQSPYGNIRFEMSRQGDRFYQTAIEKGPHGESRTRSSMDLVLGSGGVADDVFLTWDDDGSMRELPMAWLYPLQRWAVSHFNPYTHGDFARLLTVRCIECHSTWVDHVVGTANQYGRDGRILGVTCESCHGPGEQHAEYHQQHSSDMAAHAIVKPTNLERERQIEVCTQCHSNAMKHRGPAFRFRPGDRLDDHYKTVTTTATEDDRVANQISYLRQSKCFQEDAKMTCVTCHDPHRKPDASNSGSASCAKCHQAHECTDAPNLPAEVRSDCVSCHMPSYLKINVNFQTQDENFVPPLRRTEHRIAVHPHARQETLLRYWERQADEPAQEESQRLTEQLVAHFEQEAAECRKAFRFMGAIAALREVRRLSDTPEHRQQLDEAIAIQTRLDVMANDAQEAIAQNKSSEAMTLLKRILDIKPNDAKAHGFLGTEYAKAGDTASAKEHWQAVVEFDPNDAYGLTMLGWLAYLDKRDQEAIDYYLQAEEIEPRQAKMKYQMGLVFVRLNRLSDAIARFKEALEIEPRHPESLQAVIQTCNAAGRAREALPYAELIVQETHFQDANTLAVLGETYRSAGLTTEASKAFRMALELAPAQAPTLIPSLRSALKAIEQSGTREQ